MTRWRWAALAAVVAVAVGLSFGLVPASDACRSIAPQPWADFQQVRTVEAARALIAACGADHLRVGMWIDALAFIPAYAAFLLAVLRASRPRHPIGLAMIACLLVGVIADQIEGARLLTMIDAEGGSPAMIAAANKATFAKELFLALATGFVGLAVFAVRDWRRYAGALVVAASGAAVALTLREQPHLTAIASAWLLLAAVALLSAVRTDPAS